MSPTNNRCKKYDSNVMLSKNDTAIDVDEAIINGVRDRPHLYDLARIGYSTDIGKRNNSFSAIGSPLNMTGDEVAKRWKFLRERFGREKRSPNRYTKWRFYSQLSFLNDHIKPRKRFVLRNEHCIIYKKMLTSGKSSTALPGIDSTVNSADYEVGSPSGNDVDYCDTTQSFNLGKSHEEMSDYSIPSLHNSDLPPKCKRRTTDNDVQDAVRNVSDSIKIKLNNNAKTTEVMKDHMAFGIAISHRLNRLSPKQSSLAQFRIQQLLHQIEYGE